MAGPPPDVQRLPALDGVRGMAVLVVVVHNAAWITGPSTQFSTKLFTAAAAGGWAGVQLFFVLSGLLITGILLDTRGRAGYFRSFYLRRTLRIFPLYYAVVVATVFVAAPLATNGLWAQQVRSEQWAYWLYVANWTQPFGHGISGLTHLWSLAVEEQFYLLWPLLVWWLGARGIGRLALAVVLVGPAIRYGLRAAGLPPGAAYEFTIARWDALAIGALLAVWVRHEGSRAVMLRWCTPVSVVVTALLFTLVILQRGFHQDELPVQVVGQSLLLILSACLLLWAMTEDAGASSAVKRLFSTAWMCDLGQYSYAVYLLHFPIHLLLQPSLMPWVRHADDLWHLPRALAYITLVFGMSYLGARITWLLIEQPCLALRTRISPRA